MIAQANALPNHAESRSANSIYRIMFAATLPPNVIRPGAASRPGSPVPIWSSPAKTTIASTGPPGSKLEASACITAAFVMPRRFARALAARAMLAVNDGRLADAWADLLACHRLGRLVARGATLIEGLVGIAIDAIASNADLGYLANAKLTTKQTLDCLNDLRTLPPLPPIADKIDVGERFMFLDSVMMIRRGGPDESRSHDADLHDLTVVAGRRVPITARRGGPAGSGSDGAGRSKAGTRRRPVLARRAHEVEPQWALSAIAWRRLRPGSSQAWSVSWRSWSSITCGSSRSGSSHRSGQPWRQPAAALWAPPMPSYCQISRGARGRRSRSPPFRSSPSRCSQAAEWPACSASTGAPRTRRRCPPACRRGVPGHRRGAHTAGPGGGKRRVVYIDSKKERPDFRRTAHSENHLMW